jgi:sugar phosphate isomerase/epimerase
MQLAVSNLAWPPEQDEPVARLLQNIDVQGIELAPSKIWPRPLEASASEVRAYRRFWEGHGLPIVAMQALLFGRNDLTIFDGADVRTATFDYLSGMCELGARLGARALVFGAPRNRRASHRAPEEVQAISVDFFGRLGAVAARHGTSFCIEPNPPAYDCDFVTTAEEGARLVRAVATPGFALHLDTGSLSFSGESLIAILQQHGELVQHFHVSEPHLGPVGNGDFDHAGLGAQLRASAYGHWVSIEMKPATDLSIKAALARAVHTVQEHYGVGLDVNKPGRFAS